MVYSCDIFHISSSMFPSTGIQTRIPSHTLSLAHQSHKTTFHNSLNSILLPNLLFELTREQTPEKFYQAQHCKPTSDSIFWVLNRLSTHNIFMCIQHVCARMRMPARAHTHTNTHIQIECHITNYRDTLSLSLALPLNTHALCIASSTDGAQINPACARACTHTNRMP